MVSMGKKTHTNPLSKREVEILKQNPYIQSATANSVRFTEEFKRLAYEGKCHGTPVTETMRKYGIDPDMLGKSRTDGFSYTLNKKAVTESGFADQRSGNFRHPAKSSEESTEQKLLRLENELAYTRQEVEFLKKLQAANMEAQIQWESRHRQK